MLSTLDRRVLREMDPSRPVTALQISNALRARPGRHQKVSLSKLLAVLDRLGMTGYVRSSLSVDQHVLVMLWTKVADPPRVKGRRAVSTSEWSLMKDRVFRRDRFTCQACGRSIADLVAMGRTLDAHHVTKASQGGPDHADNLISLCRPGCHDLTDAPIGERLEITPLGHGAFTVLWPSPAKGVS